MRTQRLKALADRLAETDYDVIALQEIWVESEDWRYMRKVCASNYAHGTFFLTYVARLTQGRVWIRPRDSV